MVWQKTLATYHDWMAVEGWTTKDAIDVTRVQQYTFKVGLFEVFLILIMRLIVVL